MSEFFGKIMGRGERLYVEIPANVRKSFERRDLVYVRKITPDDINSLQAKDLGVQGRKSSE